MSFFVKVHTTHSCKPFYKIVAEDCLGEFTVTYHLPTICRLLNLTCEELEQKYPMSDNGPALYPIYLYE